MRPQFSESDQAELRERCGGFADNWIEAVDQRNQLLFALEGIMEQIEIGALCRETISEDASCWAKRQPPFIAALKAAYEAIRKVEGPEDSTREAFVDRQGVISPRASLPVGTGEQVEIKEIVTVKLWREGAEIMREVELTHDETGYTAIRKLPDGRKIIMHSISRTSAITDCATAETN